MAAPGVHEFSSLCKRKLQTSNMVVLFPVTVSKDGQLVSHFLPLYRN